jgi:hypothetical protein
MIGRERRWTWTWILSAAFVAGSAAAAERSRAATTGPSLEPAVAASAVRPHAIVTLPVGTGVPAGFADEVRRWTSGPGVMRVTSLAARRPAPGATDPVGFDALVIVDFTDEAGSRRWRENAKLPPAAVVRTADVIVCGEAPAGDRSAATFEVNYYRTTVGAEEYRRFCEGYIVPLMEGQRMGGLLDGYTMYLERAPAGVARAVLVKQYHDDRAYAAAAAFKLELRERLTAKHPTYPAYHRIKDTLRVNESETVADALD